LKIVNVGTSNNGGGDTLRAAFDKINSNFYNISLILDELELEEINENMNLYSAMQATNSNFEKIYDSLPNRIRKAKLLRINKLCSSKD
jgi:hypothetical protein